jgi:hypothetical protein
MEPVIYRTARKLRLAKHLMLAIVGLVNALGLAGFGMILTASEARAQAPLGTSYDSSALLDRARQKIASTTRRLLKCTCLETVERSYYAPSEKVNAKVMTEAPADSCDAKEFGGNGPLSLEVKDRLRLGVTVLGDKEIHSWAAASRFDSVPFSDRFLRADPHGIFRDVPAGHIRKLRRADHIRRQEERRLRRGFRVRF